MDFADKTSWEIMTNAIIDPEKEGKQYWNEIKNYKLGMT